MFKRDFWKNFTLDYLCDNHLNDMRLIKYFGTIFYS
jgi:hypothetical protein